MCSTACRQCPVCAGDGPRAQAIKARNELARNLGGRTSDHLLILTKDFDVLEFVLIDKETRQRHGPGGGPGVRVIPRVVTVMRKASTHLDCRILRRLTWTGTDGLAQFDKLRSVFEAAYYSGKYFQNRALFADHYLDTRLREDGAWGDDPSAAFTAIRDLLKSARSRWDGKPKQLVRDELYRPVWKLLGFKAKVAKAAQEDHLTPGYELQGADGDPLTDINLLKRHVLKQCIYGVDLNPMAVELAKVSLWLDAFTLGAPLSFLDHHLRCGNSLVGATFEDLKKATTGQLFAIDYEPLLRAINKVLFVNEMADATAAEVHKSADEYSQVRKELSGCQIVLDLLVADHFVDCGAGFQPVDQSRDREGAGGRRSPRAVASPPRPPFTSRSDVKGGRRAARSGRPPCRPTKPENPSRLAKKSSVCSPARQSRNQRACGLGRRVAATRATYRIADWTHVTAPEIFAGRKEIERL